MKLTEVVGTKKIQASEVITKADYCKIRNWNLPKNEDPDEKGRLVMYPLTGNEKPNVEGFDGYVSWSPETAFQSSYRTNGNLTFSHALDFVKKGYVAYRKNFATGGVVFAQVPAEIPVDAVSKMTSLPPVMKHILTTAENDEDESSKRIKYENQLALLNEENIITTYIPSANDLFAEDWVIERV